mmetsp:Transcript_35529/g.99813  ORF Transcript_35529/g.99813 Transcript_35529/m.99813 type:complete len:294 (-) Transcript_35529:14-895(-)
MPSAPLRRLCVHRLAGSPNEEEGISRVLLEAGAALCPGLRLDGPGVELIVSSCEPAKGRYEKDRTEVIVADKVLAVFQKVHALPYQDTFRYNYDFMYHEHMVPFFHRRQVGEFTEGYEFAHSGVRFQVVGVLPDKGYGVVGRETQLFYEGPAIERKVLDLLHMLPYEEGLPERYRPSKLSLDDEGLLKDYVRPHFEQRSSPVAVGDSVEIGGLTFKVVTCRPASGGGVGQDTQLVCKGMALKKAFDPPARAGAAGHRGGSRPNARRAGDSRSGAPGAATAAGSDQGESKCSIC